MDGRGRVMMVVWNSKDVWTENVGGMKKKKKKEVF